MTMLYYDLHIHSCLSPCGDKDMTPANIAGMAAVKGLDVIALTDHNSCRNCPAAMKHAEALGITLIPGMEMTTAEEVHVICLFPSLEAAMDFDAHVYSHLLPVNNRPDIFGEQLIMDERDQVTDTLEKLLLGATDIPFYRTEALVAKFHGICFPAHLDKSSTSLLSNLGLIPPESAFRCAEIRDLTKLHQLRRAHPYLESCRILSSSDAHYLWDIHEPDLQIPCASRSIPDILEFLSSPPASSKGDILPKIEKAEE